jgi:hypothetical protein
MDWVGGARVNTNKKAVLPLYTGKIFNYRSNQLAARLYGWFRQIATCQTQQGQRK